MLAKLWLKVWVRVIKLPEVEWLNIANFPCVNRGFDQRRSNRAWHQHGCVFIRKVIAESGAVQHAIDQLHAANHLYTGVLAPPKGKEPEDWEPREQLLFKASEFGMKQIDL